MTDLVHVDSSTHTFGIVAQAHQLAEQIAKTDFVPDGLKGNPPAVMAAMLKGHEVGMAPMQALSHIHVIKGKPAISAEGQRALVLAAGHSIRVKALTPEKCTLVGTRIGETEGTEVSYTLDEAKRAGIARGNNWANHPTDMLLARATTRLCRAVFPDVTGGLSSTEEVFDYEVEADEDGPATTVRRKAPAPRRKAAPKANPADEPVDVPLPPLPGEDGAEAVDPILEPTPSPAVERPPLPTDDIIDAEIIDDAITSPQLKKLGVVFTKNGITGREDRLAYASRFVGRELGTSKELSKDEASRLIDELEASAPFNDDEVE